MKGSVQIFAIILSFVSLSARAQETYPERAKNYVSQYAGYAIADQRSTGVPAAITLGQGILETEAGLSELMVKANNHFGIKCKNGWQGETFLHTDDAANECFKKYASAQESYHDHSAHLLKNQRYKILFTYSPTDYAKWAHGLKKCGYATNPQYAYQLIKIIEDYRLQDFSYAALDSNYKIENHGPAAAGENAIADAKKQAICPPNITTRDTTVIVTTVTTTTVVTTSQPAAVTTSNGDGIVSNDSAGNSIVVDSTDSFTKQTDSALIGPDKILSANGLKAIYAHKDDALLQYAIKYKIRYPHLLEMNDLPDEPLAFDSYIYLEKKNITGLKSKHQVKEGETLLMVAQEEGIQLKKLAALNLLLPNEQPVTGTALYLQEQAPVKPNVKPAVYVYEASATEQQSSEADMKPQAMAAAKSTEEVSFGMGFEPPKELSGNPASGNKAESHANEAAQNIVNAENRKAEDTLKKKAVAETEKQPFTRQDPSQPQLRKPATEKEYKKGDRNYIVKRGDTAFSIAKKHGITVAQLLKWNDIEAQDLKAGQTIIIKE